MDLMTRRRAMMQAVPGSSGVISATGTFTLDADGAPPVIEHNLGTQAIAVVVYPISRVTASAGYHHFYCEYINTAALIDVDTWTFNWTAYNTKTSDDVTVSVPNDNLRVGINHSSPWPTQTHWYEAGNAERVLHPYVVLTDNTVKLFGTWCSSTYRWTVWKLG